MVGDAKLTYVGTTSFGQKRQVSVPLVVNEYKDGKFETLFVGAGRLSLTRFDRRRARRRPAGPCSLAAEERPMEQILANGLYLGAQYALIALGLTLIFSLMNVLNFAHGQMYVFGGFVTYTVSPSSACPSSSGCSPRP